LKCAPVSVRGNPSSANQVTALHRDIDTLQVGDQIEIKYRRWRRVPGGEELVDRWIMGETVDCTPGRWPLVQLVDGQRTEVRPYMPWRRVGTLRQAAA